jgi:HK97 family phage prohead protease
MLLRKTLSLNDVALKVEGDSGRFAGYASVFGGVHESGDIIVKGAFDYTLRTHGKPKMFLEHSWAFTMGAAALPIGKYLVAREDDHGLYVEGEFTPGMSLSSEVRAAMKHGTLDGLSIGGFIKKGDYDETESGRVIRRWTKLVEVSPVVFPDDPSARVDGATVKGGADLLEAIEEAETIREIEQLLRDAAGLSKGAAAALVARVKSVTKRVEPAEDDAMNRLAQRLAQLAA